jgi:hypothetical protein
MPRSAALVVRVADEFCGKLLPDSVGLLKRPKRQAIHVEGAHNPDCLHGMGPTESSWAVLLRRSV